MSESDLPMMPFFVKDWIAATQDWTDAERGAYVSLLFYQWVNGKVPPDVPRLARIMGTPELEFEARWHTVGPKFDGDSNGLFNNRLEEHRKKALELRDAKARGAAGANAVRRAKRDANQARFIDALRSAQATHPSTSTSTSSEEEKKRDAGRSAYAEREVPYGALSTDSAGTDVQLCPLRGASSQIPGSSQAPEGELLREVPSALHAPGTPPAQRAASGAAAQKSRSLLHEHAGEAGETDSAAVRDLWGSEGGEAPSGLRRSMDGEMALQAVPPAGTPHKYHSQKRYEALEQRFLEFKLTYPMRGGGQSWATALKLWMKWCAQGYTPEQMIEGAERYARYCRHPRPGKPNGIERSELVMHAKRFLGPDMYFLQEWDVSGAASDSAWSAPNDDLVPA